MRSFGHVPNHTHAGNFQFFLPFKAFLFVFWGGRGYHYLMSYCPAIMQWVCTNRWDIMQWVRRINHPTYRVRVLGFWPMTSKPSWEWLVKVSCLGLWGQMTTSWKPPCLVAFKNFISLLSYIIQCPHGPSRHHLSTPWVQHINNCIWESSF